MKTVIGTILGILWVVIGLWSGRGRAYCDGLLSFVLSLYIHIVVIMDLDLVQFYLNINYKHRPCLSCSSREEYKTNKEKIEEENVLVNMSTRYLVSCDMY